MQEPPGSIPSTVSTLPHPHMAVSGPKTESAFSTLRTLLHPHHCPSRREPRGIKGLNNVTKVTNRMTLAPQWQGRGHAGQLAHNGCVRHPITIVQEGLWDLWGIGEGDSYKGGIIKDYKCLEGNRGAPLK